MQKQRDSYVIHFIDTITPKVSIHSHIALRHVQLHLGALSAGFKWNC